MASLRDRIAPIAVALAVAIAASIALVVDDEPADVIADEGPAVSATPTGSAEASAGPTATDGTSRGTAVVSGSDDETGGNIPGLDIAGDPCTARKVSETGVSDDEITIGQIVTDSNQIPQQLKPANEGLQAFVTAYNAAGGLCGRKLRLEYRNDSLNPAIHAQDARELAGRVLAFVANESLFDQLDYEQDPPFEPTVEGGGSKVPDVGGLAFSYARGQSQWHAGVIGSVSPTLVGGGNYRFYQQDAAEHGGACKKAGVVYLQEPTGASEDQARVGAVSLEESWGANLGEGNTQLYSANLFDSTIQYETLVQRMQTDGMNCVFAYTDLGSSINLAKAMRNRGVWPPSTCQGAACFRVFYIPLSAYDSKFVRDAGDASLGVSTFIPHVPLNETSSAAMRAYLAALKKVSGARPSTFSIIGFASGLMLVEALQPCREAPTRECLIDSLRKMKNFTASGLLGGTTPFRTTRVTYDDYGTFDWKWIFNHTVTMRVQDRNGKRDFYRINPKSGFFRDTLHIARGTPA
jgi:ABC-type branched-subunit amino acid transport system substrate-binding protein